MSQLAQKVQKGNARRIKPYKQTVVKLLTIRMKTQEAMKKKMLGSFQELIWTVSKIQNSPKRISSKESNNCLPIRWINSTTLYRLMKKQFRHNCKCKGHSKKKKKLTKGSLDS